MHEFGHALTALYFNQRVRIELFAMGGMTHRKGPKLALWKEFLIVMNGPLAGFVLCGLSLLALNAVQGKPSNLFIYAINVSFYVNFFWTIVNLLPVQPLDGGHLLRILLEGVFGFRGIKIAYFLSILLAAVISLYFFTASQFLIGALFGMLGFESFRMWQGISALTKQDQDEDLQKMLKTSEKAMRKGDFDDAIERLETVRARSKSGLIHIAATEYLAELLSGKGRFQEAFDMLYPYRSKVKPETLNFLHYMAFKSGNWEQAITLGNQSYQHIPSNDTAILNALSHSILGHVRPAIGWIECAISEGLPKPAEILAKREFDHIRTRPPLPTARRKNKSVIGLREPASGDCF